MSGELNPSSKFEAVLPNNIELRTPNAALHGSQEQSGISVERRLCGVGEAQSEAGLASSRFSPCPARAEVEEAQTPANQRRSKIEDENDDEDEDD